MAINFFLSPNRCELFRAFWFTSRNEFKRSFFFNGIIHCLPFILLLRHWRLTYFRSFKLGKMLRIFGKLVHPAYTIPMCARHQTPVNWTFSFSSRPNIIHRSKSITWKFYRYKTEFVPHINNRTNFTTKYILRRGLSTMQQICRFIHKNSKW